MLLTLTYGMPARRNILLQNIFVCFIKSKQNKCQIAQDREVFQTVMQNLIQILHSMRILISFKNLDLRSTFTFGDKH